MHRASTSTCSISAGGIPGPNGLGFGMENNRTEEHSNLDLLSKGHDILIRIEPQTMLSNVMAVLDAQAEIVFTEIDCGRRGVRFAIKFKASAWTQEPGDTPRYSILLGEPGNDLNSAKNSAASKVFEYMEENHHIKICDFSSRLVERTERNNTFRLLFAAMGCLDRIMFQWDLTIDKCQELITGILVKKNNELYLGTLSHIGEVYAGAVNPLNSLLVELNQLTEEARNKMDELVERRDILDQKRIEIEQRNSITESHREAQLGCKNILQSVLTFLGLPEAIYTNEPSFDSMVLCSVTFFIPFMPIYKYGGNIKLQGKGKSCQEAEERAAFEALLFIENNFKVQIADYNYPQRKESRKNEETSLEILKDMIRIGDLVKHMWGRLDNVIQSQKALLHIDPKSSFSGYLSQGQLQAFRVCTEAVEEAIKFSTDYYVVCKSDFEILNNIMWTSMSTKICLPC